jgi:hypothetical protein
MKKFAANYLIAESGAFLKNGIVVAEDNGTVLQYIDTTDDLKEIAQLTFHNGIMMAGCRFLKTNSPVSESENQLNALVMKAVEGQNTFLLPDLIELGKLIQREFPEMKIPEILNVSMDMLQSNFGLFKESIPGIFLLTGVDLPWLRFKTTTKLKRIL